MKTQYLKNQRILYSDIRKLALLEGVDDNKVSIGIWAKLKGYKKKFSTYGRYRKYYCYYVKEK